MTQDYAASVNGVAIRVTRLDATGAPATGPSASYVMSAFVSVQFTPTLESGDSFTQKTANGIICTTYKTPDTLTNVALNVAICNPDPEFSEILTGGTILSSGGNSVGYAAPAIGVDPNPNGAALEVWSLAIQGGKQASANPYFHWVFPYVKLTASGDRTIENGLLANAYSGTGVGNAAFGDGPAGDWPFTSDRAYAWARTSTAPTGTTGYVTVA